MAHRLMFDHDDPILARVRRIALSLPDSAEKVSHGRPAFHTTKVFAYYGGALKVDGAWVQHPQAIVVKPDPGDARALTEDPRAFVPAYLGPSGWLGLDLDGDTDPAEIAELIEDSFRRTASPRSIRRLDT